MKRWYSYCLTLGVSAALGPMFDGALAQGEAVGGEEKCAATNGDVNAEGKIDLTDAVTILGHLFQGNPTALVPLCAGPATASRWPATGQTSCYDAKGNAIPCDSATCPGQDGAYLTGCSLENRFTDNGDGTVTDHCTCLMWQSDAADVNGNGQSDTSDDLPWCDALAYCEILSFAGHDDWRLPNAGELESIVDYSRANPAIDPVFGVVLSTFYWSSTTVTQNPANALDVGFYIGDVDRLGKERSQYVRAVRGTAEVGGGRGGAMEECAEKNGDVNADGRIDLSDPVTLLGHLFLGNPAALAPLCKGSAMVLGWPVAGQTECYDVKGQVIPCDSPTCPGQDGAYLLGCSTENRFTENSDGTVTDHCTGLMWQKETADVNGDGQVREDGGDAPEWCDALSYCDNLNFAGHDDWRLPNVRELESIVDYGRSAPAIDPVFGAVAEAFYWSSTSLAFDRTHALTVNFNDGGDTGLISKENRHWYVRAVRTLP